MTIPREDKVKKKKAVIIDGLKRCLERDVYSRITIQEIADEAGFSKGGVLHYFPTKEDIYLELMREIFTDLEHTHLDFYGGELTSEEMAPLSALLGVESFILDKTNIRIIINLILYALEEDKIRDISREFIAKHRAFYRNIINQSRKDRPAHRKSDLEAAYLSRIVQTIVLFIGVLESIDPTDIDYVEIVRYVSAMLKN